MAFPTVAATAESSTNTAGTNHTITLPSGIQAGDLIVICSNLGTGTNPSYTTFTGYTALLDETVVNGIAVFYRWADGTETNPTFVTNVSTRDATVSLRITGAANPASIAPQIGTTAATADPPASATPPSTKDYLFIAMVGSAGEQADDDSYVTTFPTNYTHSQNEKTCGTAGTNLGGLIGVASRQLNTGAAENPGAFTVTDTTARSNTITIHPPDPTFAPPLKRKMEQFFHLVGR